jgi:transcriptional regulator with XRE-family HTH domain
MSEIVIAVQGDRLREVRIQRQLSADDVAQAAGITTRHIWRLEGGKRPNTAAITLAKVAFVLGVSLEYLLGMVDDPAPLVSPAVPIRRSRGGNEQLEDAVSVRRRRILEFFENSPDAGYQEAIQVLEIKRGTFRGDVAALQKQGKLTRKRRRTAQVPGDDGSARDEILSVMKPIRKSDVVSARRERVLDFFRDFPEATYAFAAEALGISYAVFVRDVRSLKAQGRLMREGRWGKVRVFPSEGDDGEESKAIGMREGQ